MKNPSLVSGVWSKLKFDHYSQRIIFQPCQIFETSSRNRYKPHKSLHKLEVSDAQPYAIPFLTRLFDAKEGPKPSKLGTVKSSYKETDEMHEILWSPRGNAQFTGIELDAIHVDCSELHAWPLEKAQRKALQTYITSHALEANLKQKAEINATIVTTQ